MSDIIHLLNKRIALRFIPGGFKPSLDSVMLAAACPAVDGQRVLDLGCGVGGASLCLLARASGASLTGIDIQENHAACATENAETNGMAERTTFIACDIRSYQKPPHHHVICNPPYLDDGAHLRSPSEAKATAMGHDDASLKDWVNAALRNLKSRGSLTMIHRADQLDIIMRAMDGRFGAIDVIPLWPRTGDAAKRVIIRGYKDRRAGVNILPGLVLHQDNGDYTAEAEAILRGGEAL